MKRKLAALAAVSLVFASSTAAAQSVPQNAASKSATSASRLSLDPGKRAATPAGKASRMDRRGIGIYIIGAVVLGLGVWGIIEVTKGRPSSP
jgi:hypothetical protein